MADQHLSASQSQQRRNPSLLLPGVFQQHRQQQPSPADDHSSAAPSLGSGRASLCSKPPGIPSSRSARGVPSHGWTCFPTVAPLDPTIPDHLRLRSRISAPQSGSPLLSGRAQSSRWQDYPSPGVPSFTAAKSPSPRAFPELTTEDPFSSDIPKASHGESVVPASPGLAAARSPSSPPPLPSSISPLPSPSSDLVPRRLPPLLLSLVKRMPRWKDSLSLDVHPSFEILRQRLWAGGHGEEHEAPRSSRAVERVKRPSFGVATASCGTLTAPLLSPAMNRTTDSNGGHRKTSIRKWVAAITIVGICLTTILAGS
ncbi:hypothetical protein MLD38_037197 [Melastoma candidum]|uniref:Uncharacterized protein n=1 Tax=Melastoma candidum TaxID=119954 RepID=A0ACB9LN83_9MYRT|nr:hypothetical protein MLD38_037197 [Melastoma candidum]